MSDLRKAAEMALKYFEDAYGVDVIEFEIKEALRQALAQPEQKREWVGLEDEDVATVKNEFNRGALWAEAELKEKNT